MCDTVLHDDLDEVVVCCDCEDTLNALKHGRAWKLASKDKYFIVVAIDEPYFNKVYETIRSHEIAKGRWTDEDEAAYKRATADSVRKVNSEIRKVEQC
jgi:hypothetical protein